MLQNVRKYQRQNIQVKWESPQIVKVTRCETYEVTEWQSYTSCCYNVLSEIVILLLNTSSYRKPNCAIEKLHYQAFI